MRRCRGTVGIKNACLLMFLMAAVGFMVGFLAIQTFAKYETIANDAVTVSVVMPHYSVVFNANGGEGSMLDQEFVYGVAQPLNANMYTSNGDSFLGWNTKADGTGVHYADGAEVINLTTASSVTLYAEWEGGQLRTVFRLDGPCTFGGSNGVITGDNCIDYNGNNYVGRKYIDTGILLYDGMNYDADYEIGFTIDNYAPGSNVNQATFVNAKYENQAAGYPGLAVRKQNNNLEITQTVRTGVKASKAVSVTNGMSVVIKRINDVVYYSINGGTFEVLQDMSSFTAFFDIATWFGAAPDANGAPMRVLVGTLSNMYIKSDSHTSTKYKVTFDAQNGSTPSSIYVKEGMAIEARMPSDPVREPDGNTQYYFAGWFTSDGKRVTESYVVTKDETVTARWRNSNTACKIGDTEYDTLKQAITAAGSNPVTITLLRDNNEQDVVVAANQKITFDLGDYIMRDRGVWDKPIIENNGEVTITNGILTSSQRAAVINNNQGAILHVSGGQLLATGIRQAIYNDGGYVDISGDAYFSATTGERATVQNLNNGTIEIKGGTIISAAQEAVKNESGTVKIGVLDDITIGGSVPVLQGATYGVNAIAGVEFYDGILRGIDGGINDESKILAEETDAILTHGTERIGDLVYEVLYYATE